MPIERIEEARKTAETVNANIMKTEVSGNNTNTMKTEESGNSTNTMGSAENDNTTKTSEVSESTKATETANTTENISTNAVTTDNSENNYFDDFNFDDFLNYENNLPSCKFFCIF